MDWKERFQDKVMSAEKAMDYIESGDRVVLGHAMGEPQELIRAMYDHRENFSDVEVIQLVPYSGMLAKPECEGHFVYNAMFAGGPTRDAIFEGRADFTPVFFHEVPKLFKEEILPVDVAVVMVSPPDEHGYVSFGISVDYTKPAAECAKTVIAQVNERMPRTLGHALMHVDDIDVLVAFDEEIPELPQPKIGEVEQAIGEHCASLIPDGAVLQLGIGAIPDAVLSCLGDKKNLALHSEMISDGVIPLVKSGVINNKGKSFMEGLSVVTFLMGTRELYDYVDNNPSVFMDSVDFVNHPIVIAKNDGIVSVNSAIEVDFQGQVVADMIGPKIFSGVGGQVDFVRGAAMAKDGVSIIAFPASVKGKMSRIVPNIKEGAAVTTSKNDVDYIVTEYGIARMKGKSLKQRAQALINIAHPDFREELKAAYAEKYHEEFPEA